LIEFQLACEHPRSRDVWRQGFAGTVSLQIEEGAWNAGYRLIPMARVQQKEHAVVTAGSAPREDCQNDRWIERKVMARRVRWDCLCCPVTSAGQASMELAGFRALPPVETASLVGTDYDPDAKEDLHALLHESSQSAAVVCFMMGGRDVLDLIDPRQLFLGRP
jgi:hypothetical protein